MLSSATACLPVPGHDTQPLPHCSPYPREQTRVGGTNPKVPSQGVNAAGQTGPRVAGRGWQGVVVRWWQCRELAGIWW